MNNQYIKCAITANITPTAALYKISQVSAWWLSGVQGSSQKAGDVFTVTMGTTWVRFEVCELIADEKVVWLVTDCYLPWLDDKTEWRNTKIGWEIAVNDAGTQISFTHDLVPQLPCYQQCQKAWTAYIQKSLFRFIKEGAGLPDRF